MTRTNDLGRPTGEHWGRYDAAGSLPNVSGSGVQTSQLDVGDLATVDGLIYRCTSSVPGSAAWEAIPTASQVMVPARGEIYITSSAATTPAGAGTPLKALGTTALGPDFTGYNFDMPANNRLRYTGAADVAAHVAMSCSFTSGGNNQDVSLYVALNGTVLAASRQQRKVSTGADIGSTALHIACDMSTNDYLEVFLANDTSTATVTLVYMNLFAMGMRVS